MIGWRASRLLPLESKRGWWSTLWRGKGSSFFFFETPRFGLRAKVLVAVWFRSLLLNFRVGDALTRECKLLLPSAPVYCSFVFPFSLLGKTVYFDIQCKCSLLFLTLVLRELMYLLSLLDTAISVPSCTIVLGSSTRGSDQPAVRSSSTGSEKFRQRTSLFRSLSFWFPQFLKWTIITRAVFLSDHLRLDVSQS